eukprot:12369313-Heterocapsa_arctica.AAC.1
MHGRGHGCIDHARRAPKACSQSCSSDELTPEIVGSSDELTPEIVGSSEEFTPKVVGSSNRSVEGVAAGLHALESE